MEQLSLTKFIKVIAIMPDPKEEGAGILTRVSINPMSIATYYQTWIIIAGERKELTRISVGGGYFDIDVPYKEFDDFFDGIDRGVNIED